MIFTIWCFTALGQVDTMALDSTQELTLSAVTVVSSARSSTANRQWSEEELVRGNRSNIGDLLQGSGSVHVKSYVPGGIATVSLRGAGTGRNSTTWNGMPLQGSTLGLLDYSLINVMLMEQVGVELGGDAGRYGTGSIGGNVALNNRRDFTLDEGFSFSSKTQAGSFGRFQQAAKFSLDKGKWWLSTRLAYDAAKNNFAFELRSDLPKKVNTNAAYEQLSFLQSIVYNASANQSLSLHFWTQYNYREVPPTLVQNISDAAVNDDFVRLQMIHERVYDAGIMWKNTLSYLADNNKFDDPRNGIVGINTSRQWYGKSKLSKTVDNSYWELGVSNRYTTATTINYESGRTQNQLNVFAYYALNLELWDFTASLRQEWLDKNVHPISGKLAATYQVNEELALGASLNRFYRSPGLNDQYWAPGGNINLTPERGWGAEFSLIYKPVKQLNFSAIVYQKRIENWIQWGLLESADFFSAINLPLVWSRGLEVALDYRIEMEKSSWYLYSAYQYNRSTYEFELSNPAIKSGEQTFYAPVNQAQIGVEWILKNWSAKYQQQYQSSVRTFTEPLDAWSTGMLAIGYQYRDTYYSLNVDNIWNTKYQIVERRINPGRRFSLGMNINLDQKFKK